MSGDLQLHVTDPQRLRALQAIALLDTPAEEAFDRLARLAARLLRAPVALVSLVDADRQFFKSCIGLEIEPWKSERQTPLSHSICQHNRRAGRPLVINDAKSDPLLAGNLAVSDLEVAAYLGFPLTTPDGYVLGSFCVIDSEPREWAEEDIEILRDLAASVMAEIQLRTEIATRHQVEGERDSLTQLNEQLTTEVMARREAERATRRLEAQLDQVRKIEAVGQLAGGVAHDLNNILAPILIYTSLLSDDDSLNAQHSDIISKIEETGVRAREVIRQLLTFSRMQADEFTVVALNEVIDGMEGLLRQSVPEDIDIIVSPDPNIGNILAEKSQIERVLINLVVNAADAMPHGGTLTIETSAIMLNQSDVESNPEAAPGKHVRLEVRDHGTGMDEATLDQVFEPFFSTKGTDGFGLGLATVLGVALQHDGVVAAESSPGVGTSVRIDLPVTDKDVDASDETDEPAHHHIRTGTILVAEDDDLVRESTVHALVSHGFTVLSAVDGQDALTQLQDFDGKIQLLLTDVVMPGMNGRALYQQAIKVRPHLRVLYMSGYNDDIVSHRGGLEAGAQFIAKPFLRDELLTQVDRALQQL